ncbi:MAG: TA system VapC family ribonuclease toxin, partial [Verrucomicrobiota bacterium]
EIDGEEEAPEMISCDTTILFAACNADAVDHVASRIYLQEVSSREDFCLAEQVLLEFYVLLRNPVACSHPLSPQRAVGLVQTFRSNPHWRIVDVVSGFGLMDRVWKDAGGRNFARRKVFDARLARTLQHHGVTEFATRNIKEFKSFGFKKVWDPTD